uniref:DOD-type homing endonuclease domain-containing protein n=1 Tax=candidate division CPR3 bacterium TaxID=2268181 RepID=A0A7V3N4V4_UNCC3
MKFLVYDFNLFIEHAKRLAADGKNQVFYYSPWQDAFPSFSKYAVGLGIPGVEKVLYFWNYIDEADCIVFFDVYGNDLADWLRKKGYTVFGAGKGELLENHRWMLKQVVKKAGLPLHNAVKIKGLTALREYLKTHPNKYVKIDVFRRDVDSFHAKNYESVKLLLDELDVVYGPIKDQFNFIVEDAIKADESVEPGCYDKETEVLTKRGWIKFYEANKDDLFATLNLENHKIEYQKAELFIKKYQKEIYLLQNESMDLAVSKDHTMIACSHNDMICHKNPNYKRIKIDDMDRRMYMKRTGIWEGKEQKWFYLPKIDNPKGKEYNERILMDDWLKFLGRYLAEGCITKSGYTILISQSLKHKEKREKIKDVLSRLPFKYNENGHHFRITSRHLYEYLLSLGTKENKRVPDFVKELSPRQIRIFLDSFFLGDGSFASNGKTKLYFCGLNKKLADDIQELLLKVGSFGKILTRKPNGWHKYAGRLINSQKQTYIVSEPFTQNAIYCREQLRTIPYNDYVYSVQVPNHTLYVRRNGKPIWSGNCDGFFNGEKFVEPLLLAFEIQKASYLGKFVRFKELPVQLRKILEGLQPVLKKLDYRGAFSIEAKVVSTRTAYLLDMCSRLFAPASVGYVEWIKNFDELIYKVAKKEDVEIQPSALYVACLPLESNHANSKWVMIDFDRKLEKWIKMRQYCQVGDKYYAVPGLSGVVNIIADGNSVKEVYNKIKKLVDEVDAYGLQTDVLGGLEIAQQEVEKAKSFGINF